MKRRSFAALLIAVTVRLAWWSPARAMESIPSRAGKKVLIVYLSRTGNTAVVAHMIQGQVGGDIVELELTEPYPEVYGAIVAQVAKENDTGHLPPLKTSLRSVETYDVVFLGFPTWGMQLPPPMKSLLSAYDLSGKTIIPFNTHGGYGKGNSFRSIEELCPNAVILDGLSTRGGLERDGIMLALEGRRRGEVAAEVSAWLRRIQML
jgi:flavodoxin